MKLSRFVFTLVLVSTAAHADLTRYWSGNDVDVKPRLHGPVLILAGGGGDVAVGMQTAIDTIRGCSDCPASLDIIVLRASGGDGYNGYFMSFKGVSSVASFVITDRASAERADVARSVRNAELVFFAGGDQCDYIRLIKGTATGEAVKSVYRRGGGVGGSSAGLAIQGEVAYDACPNQSAKSAEVLLDPFSADVSLSSGFFSWAPLRGVITDTHFQQRDRLGRLLVFMARTVADRRQRVTGLGVSEATVVLVGPDGLGRVYGKGPAHLIVLERAPEVLNAKTPLTARGYRIWRFETGETIHTRILPKREPKVIDVVEGKLSADPY